MDSDKNGINTPTTKPSGEKPKKDATADPKGVDETDTAQHVDEDGSTAGELILRVRADVRLRFHGNFAHCAAPIGGTEAVQTEFLTENSTPNTALSLDGRRQTGQSVGQHVCTG